jgi:hypothetical protein
LLDPVVHNVEDVLQALGASECFVIVGFPEEIFSFAIDVLDVLLTVADVVLDQLQALGRGEESKAGHFVGEDLTVFAQVGSGVHHELVEALAPGFGDAVDARLTVALLDAPVLLNLNKSLLLQPGQQRVESAMTEGGVGADHVVDDLGNQIAVGRASHEGEEDQ